MIKFSLKWLLIISIGATIAFATYDLAQSKKIIVGTTQDLTKDDVAEYLKVEKTKKFKTNGHKLTVGTGAGIPFVIDGEFDATGTEVIIVHGGLKITKNAKFKPPKKLIIDSSGGELRERVIPAVYSGAELIKAQYSVWEPYVELQVEKVLKEWAVTTYPNAVYGTGSVTRDVLYGTSSTGALKLAFHKPRDNRWWFRDKAAICGIDGDELCWYSRLIKGTPETWVEESTDEWTLLDRGDPVEVQKSDMVPPNLGHLIIR